MSAKPTYEECMLAILAAPEDDEPRRRLADALRDTDPEWARLIELQLDHTQKKRANNNRVGTLHHDSALLWKHERRWTQNLRFYLGDIPNPDFEFYRGLPWLCSMGPYTFLEQGDYIFNRVAPIRGIEFVADPDGDPFPAKEIANCPMLARLDEIRFREFALGEHDLEIIAASEHLDRVMYWDVRGNWQPSHVWDVFAANPKTRKCLSIRNGFEASDGGPLGECTTRFEARVRRFEMSAEGKALEKKYGYLPWLHQGHACNPADAHYWVEHHILPLFVPGSPADSPTPFGSGLWAREKLEPRENFDIRDIFESITGA